MQLPPFFPFSHFYVSSNSGSISRQIPFSPWFWVLTCSFGRIIPISFPPASGHSILKLVAVPSRRASYSSDLVSFHCDADSNTPICSRQEHLSFYSRSFNASFPSKAMIPQALTVNFSLATSYPAPVFSAVCSKALCIVPFF